MNSQIHQGKASVGLLKGRVSSDLVKQRVNAHARENKN
jgi:hypothetical protein